MSLARDTRQASSPLGLPHWIRGCLFDLDGVLTDTARLHAEAWKATFDLYLAQHARRRGERYLPFRRPDYERYVDGRQRYDGVRAFLASRGIPCDEETASALGDRKNEVVLRRMRRDGIEAFPGSVRYLHAVRGAGLALAVVSASANCAAALEAAGLADAFEVRIDGVRAAAEQLRGKPAPDTFLAAAQALSLEPADAAVFEDALVGVAAGRAGGFGFVVGVDRTGHAEALRREGADVVVSDLADLLEQA